MTITRYPLADPADLPDLDRVVPAGLCWRAPLEPRPIVLGEAGPTLIPALAIDGGRYWRGTEYGLGVGRSARRLRQAAEALAFQPAPTTGEIPMLDLADAVTEYLHAVEVTR